MSMSNRTSRVTITNEARILRQMRIDKGLSMRKAGELIGRSDSYISQIENGRMDVPEGEVLERMLDVYEGPKVRSFKERARLLKHQMTPREELDDLVCRLSDERVLLALNIVKGLLI